MLSSREWFETYGRNNLYRWRHMWDIESDEKSVCEDWPVQDRATKWFRLYGHNNWHLWRNVWDKDQNDLDDTEVDQMAVTSENSTDEGDTSSVEAVENQA